MAKQEPERSKASADEPAVSEPDRESIDVGIGLVNGLLAQHAGGIELRDVDDQGRITVQFVGMCAGCLYRPVTMAATVRPALMELTGVEDVVAAGSSIDDGARQRLEEEIGSWWTPLRLGKSEQ